MRRRHHGYGPTTSALNRYLQCWDVPNVFVPGANAFPQNNGYNPTGLVGGLTYWSAKAIREQYIKSPGALVQGRIAMKLARALLILSGAALIMLIGG